ncbi:transporter substrate-binding domain-containing protein [Aerococcaceae bacterium DSM 111022]|nr:transporter substrate-binding domain-containing protein [Aerococcaceae bacterium DSM 111022]
MKKSTKLFMALVALFIALSPLSISAQRSLEDIKEDGKIIMATSADFPPFEWTIMEDGEPQIVGIDAELAQKIADKIGVELEIQDTSFESLVTQVQSGRADFVAAGMSYNPERENVVNFSDIYYETTTSFVINNENVDNFKVQEDFNSAKIGVQKGTIQEELAKDTFPDAEIVSMNKNGDLVEALKTGRIDGVMMDTIVVSEFVAQNEDIIQPVEGLEIKLGDDGFAMITNKANEDLLAVINEVLNETIESGEMDEIIQKYIELNSSQSADDAESTEE